LAHVLKNPIIHIYPKYDTYNADGELEGYIDSLFCDIHVYDIERMTKWKSKRTHDGIMPFANLNIDQIKIFKDLSTMICLQGEYRLSGSSTAFSVGKI
jgi:hypothetical protein